MDGPPATGAVSPQQRFRRTLEGCRAYVVASSLGSAARPGPVPPELGSLATERFDPMRTGAAPFLDRLQHLNELVDGPSGRAMPRWVFYDCGEVPGGIVGLAVPARRLPDSVLESLRLEVGPEALVPVSMIVAIPMIRVGWWQLYGLGAINQIAPGAAAAGLRAITVGLAASMLGVETACVAAPWRSAMLSTLGQLAPLPMITAWTPAHSTARTATLRLPAAPQVIERLSLGSQPCGGGDATWVDVDDDDALRDVQRRLEDGVRIELAGPPRVDGSLVEAPIREVGP